MVDVQHGQDLNLYLGRTVSWNDKKLVGNCSYLRSVSIGFIVNTYSYIYMLKVCVMNIFRRTLTKPPSYTVDDDPDDMAKLSWIAFLENNFNVDMYLNGQKEL